MEWSTDAYGLWSPMLPDFDPGFEMSRNSGNLSASNTSVGLHIEVKIGDGTIDLHDLSLDPWSGTFPLNTLSQRDRVQPPAGSAILTDVGNVTRFAGGVDIECQPDDLHDLPESNMHRHKADDILEMFLTEKALDGLVEVPTEPKNRPVRKIDLVVPIDHSGPAKVRPVTDESMTLSTRNATTSTNRIEKTKQCARDSAKQYCRQCTRRGRKKRATRVKGEKSIGAKFIKIYIKLSLPETQPETLRDEYYPRHPNRTQISYQANTIPGTNSGLPSQARP